MRAADIDEMPQEGENAEDYVLRIAEAKAAAVALCDNEMILAADTCVVLAGEIMGKPKDDADALRMLTALAGRRHDVVTGFCLRRGRRIMRDFASTAVWFSPLSDEDIREYIATGEPKDKAGAYGIQGRASRYIDRIDGSYTNVVGLPVSLVWRKLCEFDIDQP